MTLNLTLTRGALSQNLSNYKHKATLIIIFLLVRLLGVPPRNIGKTVNKMPHLA